MGSSLAWRAWCSWLMATRLLSCGPGVNKAGFDGFSFRDGSGRKEARFGQTVTAAARLAIPRAGAAGCNGPAFRSPGYRSRPFGERGYLWGWRRNGGGIVAG